MSPSISSGPRYHLTSPSEALRIGGRRRVSFGRFETIRLGLIPRCHTRVSSRSAERLIKRLLRSLVLIFQPRSAGHTSNAFLNLKRLYNRKKLFTNFHYLVNQLKGIIFFRPELPRPKSAVGGPATLIASDFTWSSGAKREKDKRGKQASVRVGWYQPVSYPSFSVVSM